MCNIRERKREKGEEREMKRVGEGGRREGERGRGGDETGRRLREKGK